MDELIDEIYQLSHAHYRGDNMANDVAKAIRRHLSGKVVLDAGEVESLKRQNEVLRAHAIAQDCGRLCDKNKQLNYKEQWKGSEAFVDGLAKRAAITRKVV